ncbi:MAG: nifS [Chlamydiales bacterium]|nr:nifS [Chlamydiales bacterium]
MAKEVAEAIRQFLSEDWGNPSSIHSFGQKSRNLLAEVRSQIANLFRVKPQEVTFTSSGSEALNFLLKGFYLKNRPRHVISSNLEHLAVQSCMKWMEKQGAALTFLKPGALGAVSPDLLEEAIRPETGLISLMAVNNETGVKTDVQAIAQVAKRHGIPLIVDGVAWLGKEKLTLSDGVSGIAFSGHKIHAPAGIGFAILGSKMGIEPLIDGGGQELGRRSGTENLLGIAALSKALKLLDKSLPEAERQMEFLRNRLEYGLLEVGDAWVNGGDAPRISNTTNVSFAGVDGETLLMSLDLKKIAVSHGSACSSGAREPSRILINMGVPYQLAASSIRFSLSRYTTQEEVDACISIVRETILRLRSF